MGRYLRIMTALRSITGFCLTAMCALAVLTMATAPSPAKAQLREVPYWAALRFDRVFMRVGPSQEYKIDWVYKRKGLPVKVVRVRESWRLVEDPEGVRGWIASSQLTPTRGTVVIGEGAIELRESADRGSALRWRAEPGVVAKLLRCREDRCEIDVTGRVGWVDQDRLWGAGEP
ncbi:SH3 domain-containing protein [Erythrobacter sp. MTPC3]|uniref:SH3 domain-containing protein n=1 Tax=Erythrobacter sp. MTPC3 TaxID=3056564 RepID=UPI0036F22501